MSYSWSFSSSDVTKDPFKNSFPNAVQMVNISIFSLEGTSINIVDEKQHVLWSFEKSPASLISLSKLHFALFQWMLKVNEIEASCFTVEKSLSTFKYLSVLHL